MSFLLVQVVAQVSQTFPLLADGTAACCLQIGELLELLPVDFVCFLVSETNTHCKKICIMVTSVGWLQKELLGILREHRADATKLSVKLV